MVAPSEYIVTNSTSEQQLSGSRFSSDDSEDSDASSEDGDEEGEGEGPGQPWHQQEEEGTALSRCVADFLSNSADTTLLLLGEVGHAPALYLAASPVPTHGAVPWIVHAVMILSMRAMRQFHRFLRAHKACLHVVGSAPVVWNFP